MLGDNSTLDVRRVCARSWWRPTSAPDERRGPAAVPEHEIAAFVRHRGLASSRRGLLNVTSSRRSPPPTTRAPACAHPACRTASTHVFRPVVASSAAVRLPRRTHSQTTSATGRVQLTSALDRLKGGTASRPDRGGPPASTSASPSTTSRRCARSRSLSERWPGAACSVVVPTYNQRENSPAGAGAPRLGETIDVWVADDGSPDAPGRRCANSRPEYPGRVTSCCARERERVAGGVSRGVPQGAWPTRATRLRSNGRDFSHHPLSCPSSSLRLENLRHGVGSALRGGRRVVGVGLSGAPALLARQQYIAAVAGGADPRHHSGISCVTEGRSRRSRSSTASRSAATSPRGDRSRSLDPRFRLGEVPIHSRPRAARLRASRARRFYMAPSSTSRCCAFRIRLPAAEALGNAREAGGLVVWGAGAPTLAQRRQREGAGRRLLAERPRRSLAREGSRSARAADVLGPEGLGPPTARRADLGAGLGPHCRS